MEEKGCIIGRHTDGQTDYALRPFVLGFFEAAVNRLTPGFYTDVRRFYMEGFAMEYPTISLVKKDHEFVPPRDLDEFNDRLMQNKEGMGGKLARMAKAIVGMKV